MRLSKHLGVYQVINVHSEIGQGNNNDVTDGSFRANPKKFQKLVAVIS